MGRGLDSAWLPLLGLGGRRQWRRIPISSVAIPNDTVLGCPLKLVSIRNNPKLELKPVLALSEQNICFGCFASMPKQRVSVFPLNRNEQKSNRNSMIKSLFWYFFRKFWVFPVCFGLFRNSLFQLFHFYTETESFDVKIEPKQTKDQPKQFYREHILVFFWKFRVVLVCYGLFQTSSVCFGCCSNTETKWNFCFWFHETNRNTTETDLISVCFGSDRKFFLFVTRTPYTVRILPRLAIHPPLPVFSVVREVNPFICITHSKPLYVIWAFVDPA